MSLLLRISPWLVGLAVLAPRSTARADDVQWFGATSVHPRFDDGLEIGPDARVLRYEFSDRWRASVGGEIVLVGLEAAPGALALTLSGLLELSNEDDDPPVPYQLLRALIGVGVRAATPRQSLDVAHRYRISGELAYTHESDHPSGSSDVALELGRWVSLDDFSSFEHIRLAGRYEHWLEDWLWLSGGIAVRVYTPPVSPLGERELRAAFELTLRARARIHGPFAAFVAFYAEGLGHELSPGRVGVASLPSLFTVIRLEAGVTLATEDVGRLELYVGVVDEHGRGLDFIRHYGPSFLAGLRAGF